MAQVKFYAMTSLPTGSNLDENGVYFIKGGELYKGAQRFGLGRVTIVANGEGLSSIENPARGDIAATTGGAAWVYADDDSQTPWKVIGGDTQSLQSLWRADIKSWTSGLVSTAQDNGTYIKQITQAEDGKVSAKVSNFATDVKTAVGNGDASSTANGITVSVTTTSGSVTGVQVSASQINCNSVTASTATFTDLTVTSTATFSATEVSAGSLTIDNVPVNNVSASTASDTDAGVAVTVGTENGGVKSVDVAVTGNLATFAGKSVVTTLGTASTATNDNIATEKAVRDALNAFDNAMHFRGVVTAPSAITDPQSGDIVVIGSDPATGYVTGQEFIWDGTKWEKIGDQSFVTGGGESKTDNGITVEVSTAATTASATVTLTVDAVEAAADVSVAAKATNVVTAGAVADFVTGITNNKASVGTGIATGGYGISGEVVLNTNAAPTLDITVAPVSTSAGVTTGANTVVTAGAVADYVTGAISTATAYDPTGETVTANANTLDKAMHAVAGAVDALKTKTDAYSGGTATGSWTATGASKAAISTTVGIDASTMAPTVTMAVDVDELKSALGLGAAAYRDVSTSVSDTTSTALVTEGAVATALAWITD